VFFAPFAALASVNPLAARLAWHFLNLLSLVIAIWLTVRMWSDVRQRARLEPRPFLAMAFLPTAAVLLPLLTNFEHQNMNALLLGLLAATTWHVLAGSAVVAGLLLGVATALKAFPALVILYLLARRWWGAAVTATVTAFVLTVSPVVLYGLSGFGDLVATFARLAQSGWPARGNNQSMVAALDRFAMYVRGAPPDAGVHIASDAPLTAALFAAAALGCVAAMVMVLGRSQRQAIVAPSEITAVTILAILFSPIAWDHYWVMMLPAFVFLYDSRTPALLGQTASYMFWTAAVLTTGLSPIVLGQRTFNDVREFSSYTIAGVVLFAGMLAVSKRVLILRRKRSTRTEARRPSGTREGG
jgi:hypothetical protein